MESRPPLFIADERKEPQPCFGEPLNDRRRMSIGYRRVDASIDDEIPMHLVSRGLQGRDIHCRSAGDLFVAIVKNIDIVRTPWPVLVEHQAACQVARLRAIPGKAAQDVALELSQRHVSSDR